MTAFVASEPEVDFDQLPVFLVDGRTRPGQSGSTVILYNESRIPVRRAITITTGQPFCQLLGIYSGRIHEDSDIGMVWKLTAIEQVVQPMLPKPLSTWAPP